MNKDQIKGSFKLLDLWKGCFLHLLVLVEVLIDRFIHLWQSTSLLRIDSFVGDDLIEVLNGWIEGLLHSKFLNDFLLFVRVFLHGTEVKLLDELGCCFSLSVGRLH